MQHILEYSDFVDHLNEIGDGGSGSYSFSLLWKYWGDRTYGFNTPSHPYRVELKTEEDEPNKLYVKFFVTSRDDEELADIETNAGELFRIMATVAKIIKYDLQSNRVIDTLTFNPVMKKGETRSNISRLNLYLKYIKHEYPKATASQRGEFVHVKIR